MLMHRYLPHMLVSFNRHDDDVSNLFKRLGRARGQPANPTVTYWTTVGQLNGCRVEGQGAEGENEL